MPAGISAIRHALAARLGSIEGFTAYPYLVDSIIEPCAWIEPDRPFVDYEKAFKTRQVAYRFLITVLVNRFDEPTAQDNLDGFLDPEGDFIRLIHDEDGEIEDDLTNLVSYATVTQGTRYGAYSIGGTTYLGAQLMVDVFA